MNSLAFFPHIGHGRSPLCLLFRVFQIETAFVLHKVAKLHFRHLTRTIGGSPSPSRMGIAPQKGQGFSSSVMLYLQELEVSSYAVRTDTEILVHSVRPAFRQCVFGLVISACGTPCRFSLTAQITLCYPDLLCRHDLPPSRSFALGTCRSSTWRPI